MLLSAAWPLQPTGPLRVTDRGMQLVIGGHDVTRSDVMAHECAEACIKYQHLLCVLYSGELSLKRLALGYSPGKGQYAKFRQMIEEVHNLWISKVDENGNLTQSSRILQWAYKSAQLGHLSNIQSPAAKRARTIDRLEEGTVTAAESEWIRVDLDYLRGATLAQKSFYFMLVAHSLGSAVPEKIEIQFDTLKEQWQVTRRSYREFFSRYISPLSGDCWIADQMYRIEIDALKQVVVARPVGNSIKHSLADFLRENGAPEHYIRAKFHRVDAIPEWCVDLVCQVAGLTTADFAAIELFLARAYASYAKRPDGSYHHWGSDQFRTRLHTVCKAATVVPRQERGRYITASMAAEARQVLAAERLNEANAN